MPNIFVYIHREVFIYMFLFIVAFHIITIKEKNDAKVLLNQFVVGEFFQWFFVMPIVCSIVFYL